MNQTLTPGVRKSIHGKNYFIEYQGKELLQKHPTVLGIVFPRIALPISKKT